MEDGNDLAANGGRGGERGDSTYVSPGPLGGEESKHTLLRVKVNKFLVAKYLCLEYPNLSW